MTDPDDTRCKQHVQGIQCDQYPLAHESKCAIHSLPRDERDARVLAHDERNDPVELAMVLLSDPARFEHKDSPLFKLWVKRSDRTAERLGWTW